LHANASLTKKWEVKYRGNSAETLNTRTRIAWQHIGATALSYVDSEIDDRKTWKITKSFRQRNEKKYADLNSKIKVVDFTVLHLMTMTIIGSTTSNKLMMLFL